MRKTHYDIRHRDTRLHKVYDSSSRDEDSKHGSWENQMRQSEKHGYPGKMWSGGRNAMKKTVLQSRIED